MMMELCPKVQLNLVERIWRENADCFKGGMNPLSNSATAGPGCYSLTDTQGLYLRYRGELTTSEGTLPYLSYKVSIQVRRTLHTVPPLLQSSIPVFLEALGAHLQTIPKP